MQVQDCGHLANINVYNAEFPGGALRGQLSKR
ncbi:MAG: CHRD domain-containing protein [Frankiaceae bacterium]|nr:CHRD domain-containing protein [Frankiaceae bacterium]